MGLSPDGPCEPFRRGSGQQAEFFVNPAARRRTDFPIWRLPCGRIGCLLGAQGRGRDMPTAESLRIRVAAVRAAQAPDADVALHAAAPHGQRFERRRADIVAAAIPVLNAQGFKGMRLTAVAELTGLRATGVTYYFPRKEELALACLESGFAVFHELLAIAEREATPRARIQRLIHLFVERDCAAREGRAPPTSSFSSIRALEDEHRERAVEGYKQVFRRVRSLFEGPDLASLDKVSRSIRTLILLEQLYW